MANASTHVHRDSRVILKRANAVARPEPHVAVAAAATVRSAAATSVWIHAHRENHAILRRASAAARQEHPAGIRAAAIPRLAAMGNVSTPAHLVSISTLGRANARLVNQATPVVQTAARPTRSVAPIPSRACPAEIRMGTVAAASRAATCAVDNTSSAVARPTTPIIASHRPVPAARVDRIELPESVALPPQPAAATGRVVT